MQFDLLEYIAKTPRAPRRAADTSVKAAKKVKPELLREKVRAFVKKQGADGATPDETAIGLSIDLLNIRPRFTELKDSGQIRLAGLRRPNRKGNTVRVWVAAP